MSDWLAHLNSQQRQAVTAPAGPTLVLAGPGSGKTRVLTQRVAYLVGLLQVPPHKIMAVTFTNKAAGEMKARVEALLGGQLRGLTIGTFHAICARWLRREAAYLPVTAEFVIFDTADQEALVKQALKEFNIDEKRYRPAGLLAKISRAKNELVAPADYPAQTYAEEITRRVYTRYQALLIANNALDFDDLLVSVVRLFKKQPEVLARYQQFYEHILVDEFQDTNTVQYTLLGQLTATRHNLYVVGDPDQSVYRWRGADYRNVHRFQQDFPEAQTILLEQNYRSTQVILDAAMAVIDRHPGRTRKQLFTERAGGVELVSYEAYNEEEEADYIVAAIQNFQRHKLFAPGDCAVMYRTNAQSRAVEEALVRAHMPYKLVGAQRFYGRKEIKDALAFLRLIHNPADAVSLTRVINVPPRGVGPKTVDGLLAAANAAACPPAEILRDLAAAGKESKFAAEFTGKAGAALAHLGQLLNDWRAVKDRLAVAALLDTVLKQTGYQAYLRDGTEEGEERWANVLELRGVAQAFPETPLAEFLEQVALVSDQDTLAEAGKAATLLTLHAAKGLEFPVVFIIGLDDGVLPHQRSFEDPEAMLEERRLLYVGMTRAKERLYLLRAFRRSLYGDSAPALPSRFLKDIPAKFLQGPAGPAPGRKRSARSGDPDWSAPASPPPAATRFRTGQRVHHGVFGDGVVIEAKLLRGDEEVTVVFEGVGVKRLVAAVANLKLLEG